MNDVRAGSATAEVIGDRGRQRAVAHNGDVVVVKTLWHKPHYAVFAFGDRARPCHEEELR
jgi:hypothetical protein